jgi:hypothetical protein
MLMVKSTLLWVIDDAASVAKRRNLLHRTPNDSEAGYRAPGRYRTSDAQFRVVGRDCIGIESIGVKCGAAFTPSYRDYQ